jgi:uncharacterized protein YjaG (DUF416 family)
MSHSRIAKMNALSKPRRVALGCLMARELFPYYLKFHEKAEWGNPDVLRTIIGLSEGWLGGNPMPDFASLRAAISEIGPDLDEWSIREASFALNACAACYSLMDLLEGQDQRALEWLLDLWQETLEQKSWDEGKVGDEVPSEENPILIEAWRKLEGFVEDLNDGRKEKDVLKAYFGGIAW